MTMYLPDQIDQVAGTRKAPAHVRDQWLHDPSSGRRLVPRRESGPQAIEQARKWGPVIASLTVMPSSGKARRIDPIYEVAARWGSGSFVCTAHATMR